MDDLVCNFLESGELVLNFMGDAVDGIGIVGQPFEVGFVFMKNRLDRHFKQMRFRLTHKKKSPSFWVYFQNKGDRFACTWRLSRDKNCLQMILFIV